MKRLILYATGIGLLLSILNTSCCTTKTLANSTKDSIRIETITRTEYIKDTVFFEVPVEVKVNVVKDTISNLETSLAVSTAQIDSNGNLSHSLKNKVKNVPILTKKEVIYRDSIVYRDKANIQTIEVPRELTKWQKFRLNGFWVLLLILGVGVYLKIKKIF